MYWAIAYCVLVAIGLVYCLIHDHWAARHSQEQSDTYCTKTVHHG